MARSVATEASSKFEEFAALRRPAIMGVLNVTPDSFSDGGQYFVPERAVARAAEMARQGAAILDIGAESTRPYGGARPIAQDEEISRLAPVLDEIVKLGRAVSIDTMKAAVARWALERGATYVNDVWGLQRDPDMARVVADFAVPVVVMHNRESVDPAVDIMEDIEAFFGRSLETAERAGISRRQIILDPGIGFGKTAPQSMTVLARLGRLNRFGLPLLVGASRKRFIDSVSPAPTEKRLGGSLAAHLIAAEAGAAIIRTHDVEETLQAIEVAEAIRRHGREAG